MPKRISNHCQVTQFHSRSSQGITHPADCPLGEVRSQSYLVFCSWKAAYSTLCFYIPFLVPWPLPRSIPNTTDWRRCHATTPWIGKQESGSECASLLVGNPLCQEECRCTSGTIGGQICANLSRFPIHFTGFTPVVPYKANSPSCRRKASIRLPKECD